MYLYANAIPKISHFNCSQNAMLVLVSKSNFTSSHTYTCF